MKLQTKLLKPNPYRDLSRYPVDRAKVETLKKSISDTDFWDNLLARKFNGEYQIAYGHHRLLALQELGIDEIDIPVKDISDFQMVRIMANENSIQYGGDPSVILETVRAVKEFLNFEFAKYGSWAELPDLLTDLLEGDTDKGKKNALEKVKRGVGQTTIFKFLGDGWKQWQIREALAVLNDEDADVDIANEIGDLNSNRIFNSKAKKYKVPKEDRKALAQKIKGKYNSHKEIADAIDAELGGEPSYEEQIEKLALAITDVNNDAKKLADKIDAVNDKAKELGITSIENFLSNVDTANSFTTLFHAINRYVKVYNVELNSQNHE